MNTQRDQDPPGLALEAMLAVGTSILIGAGAAWLVFSGALPHVPKSYGWIAPASLLSTFAALALIRFPRRDASVLRVAVVTLLGLAAVLLGGSAAILLIGCRFDACINL